MLLLLQTLSITTNDAFVFFFPTPVVALLRFLLLLLLFIVAQMGVRAVPRKLDLQDSTKSILNWGDRVLKKLSSEHYRIPLTKLKLTHPIIALFLLITWSVPLSGSGALRVPRYALEQVDATFKLKGRREEEDPRKDRIVVHVGLNIRQRLPSNVLVFDPLNLWEKELPPAIELTPLELQRLSTRRPPMVRVDASNELDDFFVHLWQRFMEDALESIGTVPVHETTRPVLH